MSAQEQARGQERISSSPTYRHTGPQARRSAHLSESLLLPLELLDEDESRLLQEPVRQISIWGRACTAAKEIDYCRLESNGWHSRALANPAEAQQGQLAQTSSLISCDRRRRAHASCYHQGLVPAPAHARDRLAHLPLPPLAPNLLLPCLSFLHTPPTR
jgi:hypothetical protein